MDLSDLLNVNVSIGLSATARNHGSECAICQQVCDLDDIIVQHRSCLHCFHAEECLLLWLERSTACPMCGSPIRRPDRRELIEGGAKWQAYWGNRASQRNQAPPGFAAQELFRRSVFVARTHEHIRRDTAEQTFRRRVQDVEEDIRRRLGNVLSATSEGLREVSKMFDLLHEHASYGRPMAPMRKAICDAILSKERAIRSTSWDVIFELNDEMAQRRIPINRAYDSAVARAEQHFVQKISTSFRALMDAREQDPNAIQWRANPSLPRAVHKNYRPLRDGVRDVFEHCPRL